MRRTYHTASVALAGMTNAPTGVARESARRVPIGTILGVPVCPGRKATPSDERQRHLDDSAA
ncbi:hypothetical protein GCM10010460_28010 [Microbacterium terrae]|nr:hypothetical protein GCM10017594_31900 [Microbacterium terrae]